MTRDNSGFHITGGTSAPVTGVPVRTRPRRRCGAGTGQGGGSRPRGRTRQARAAGRGQPRVAVASLAPKPMNSAPTPVVSPADSFLRARNWLARKVPPKISTDR